RVVTPAFAAATSSNAGGSPQTVSRERGPLVAGPTYLHPDSPSWGPRDLTIVYVWTRERVPIHSVAQIHELRIAGDQDRQILPEFDGTIRRAFEPAYSRDGQELAIVVDGHIATVALPNGSPVVFATAAGHAPSWSPDGTSIVYVVRGNPVTGSSSGLHV